MKPALLPNRDDDSIKDAPKEKPAEEKEEDDTWNVKKTAIICAVVGVFSAGGIGGYMTYLRQPEATKNVAAPAPPPEKKLDVSEVWKPLEQPSKHSVPGLELPAPMEVAATRKYVTVPAKCSGEVRWMVRSQNHPHIEVMESKMTNTVIIFPSKKEEEDLITVMAYTCVDGKPGEIATTTIKVVPATPVPTPKDDPPVVSTLSLDTAVKHITFVLDTGKQAASAEIVNNKTLRADLKAADINVHEFSVPNDLDSLQTLRLLDQVNKLARPVVVYQDDKGNVLLAEKLTSVQQVRDAIAKFKKGAK